MREDAMARIYRSFEEFEREELCKLDSLHVSAEDVLDTFDEEFEFRRNDPTQPHPTHPTHPTKKIG